MILESRVSATRDLSVATTVTWMILSKQPCYQLLLLYSPTSCLIAFVETKGETRQECVRLPDWLEMTSLVEQRDDHVTWVR